MGGTKFYECKMQKFFLISYKLESMKEKKVYIKLCQREDFLPVLRPDAESESDALALC